MNRGSFPLLNRFGNPFVRALLRSPAHPLASGRLILITVQGRRSGRSFTIPTGYARDGDDVVITVGLPERKLWWRNLRGSGAPVELLIRGERLRAHATAVGDEETGVVVRARIERSAASDARASSSP